MRWIMVAAHVSVQNAPPLHSLLPIVPKVEGISTTHPNEVWVRYAGVTYRLLGHEYVFVGYTEFMDYIDISHEYHFEGDKSWYTVKDEWRELFTRQTAKICYTKKNSQLGETHESAYL